MAELVCTEIKRVIEIEIGSLLSNTLILLVVLLFVIYILYAILKYKRLYPFGKKGQETKN